MYKHLATGENIVQRATARELIPTFARLASEDKIPSRSSANCSYDSSPGCKKAPHYNQQEGRAMKNISGCR
jgi:hypothetical protein